MAYSSCDHGSKTFEKRKSNNDNDHGEAPWCSWLQSNETMNNGEFARFSKWPHENLNNLWWSGTREKTQRIEMVWGRSGLWTDDDGGWDDVTQDATECGRLPTQDFSCRQWENRRFLGEYKVSLYIRHIKINRNTPPDTCLALALSKSVSRSRNSVNSHISEPP